MKILINYANHKYKKTQNFNTWTGKKIGGFEKIYSFSPKDIDENFQKENRHILDIKRGNGLWLWKPYFILKVMKESKDGDVIFYCDSGSFFVRDVGPLIKSIDKKSNIWVSDIPLLEKNFTKHDCFKYMNCFDDEFMNTNQIQATFFMVINNEKTRAFVEKWLNYCRDLRLILPEDDSEKNEDLMGHREDQSILSLLCKKEKITPQLDPSQRGKYPKWYQNEKYYYSPSVHYDKYKPVIFLHKTPDVNVINCFKQYLKCIKKNLS